MAPFPSIRSLLCLLVPGFVLTASVVYGATQEPSQKAFFVVEYQPTGGPCPAQQYHNEFMFNGRTPTAYTCDDTHAQVGVGLTCADAQAVFAFPVFCENTVYPEWTYGCLPFNPGTLEGKTCDPKPQCKTCDGNAPADPQNSVGDPVDLTTGYVAQTPVDLDLGHGLRFARHYSSASAGQTGVMGKGWEHSLQWTIQSRTTAALHQPLVFVHPPFRTAAVFVQTSPSSPYRGSLTDDGSLTVDSNGTAHYTAVDGTVASFSSASQLISIQPVGEPLITVTYNGNSTTYSNGQQTIVVTTSSGMVSGVTGGGQSWSYTYDSSRNLHTVTGPDPTNPNGTITWTYSYGNPGFLTGISRSDLTQPLATWTYGTALPTFPTPPVATADEQALEQPLSFSYSVPDGNHLLTTVSAGSNQLAVFDTTNGMIFGVTNPRGPANPNSSGVNPVPGGAGVPVPFVSQTVDSGLRTQTKTDKNGNVTSYLNYDPRTNPGSIQEKDAHGNLVRRRDYTYHPTLEAPLTVTETSAVTGVFGDKVETFDYDDPSAPGYNPLTPNANPTIHLFSQTVAGKDSERNWRHGRP